MIRRERSALQLTCDGCGQIKQDTKYRRHKEAWDEAKKLGWTPKPIKEGKDWEHYCPECSGEQGRAGRGA